MALCFKQIFAKQSAVLAVSTEILIYFLCLPILPKSHKTSKNGSTTKASVNDHKWNVCHKWIKWYWMTSFATGYDWVDAKKKVTQKNVMLMSSIMSINYLWHFKDSNLNFNGRKEKKKKRFCVDSRPSSCYGCLLLVKTFYLLS